MVYNGTKWDKVVHKKYMFIGEFTHTLDEKKRLSLPSKFRKELGSKVIVTYGLDNCLFMFTPVEWENIASKLGGLSMGNPDSRAFNRIMLGGATELEVDSAGRILLPDFLREHTGIVGGVDKKLVFTGVYSKVEIWEEKKWKVYKENVLKQADSLAAKLGEIGVI